MAGLRKILICLSLFSAITLSINCNAFCEVDLVKSSELASLHSLGGCNESSNPQEEFICEWDLGSLNFSHKEKFTNLFNILSSISSYLPFANFVLSIERTTSDLHELLFYVAIYSDPVFSINTIRILV